MKKNLIVIIIIAVVQNIYAQKFYEYDVELIQLKSQETIFNLGNIHTDITIKNIPIKNILEEYNTFNSAKFKFKNIEESDFKTYLNYLNRKYKKKRIKLKNPTIKYKLGYLTTKNGDNVKGAIINCSYILHIKNNNNKLKTILYGSVIFLLYEEEKTYISEIKTHILGQHHIDINLEEQAKIYNLIDLISPIQTMESIDSSMFECDSSILEYQNLNLKYQNKTKVLEFQLNQLLGNNFEDENSTGFINSNYPSKILTSIDNSTSINDLFSNLDMTENERRIMTVLFKEANKGLIVNGMDGKNTLKLMKADENIITLNGKIWLPNFAAFNIQNSENYEHQLGEVIYTDIWTVEKKGQVKINSITPNYSNVNATKSSNSYFHSILLPKYLQQLLLVSPSSYTINVTIDNPSNKTKWVEIPIGQLVNSIETNSHELQVLSVYKIVSRSGNIIQNNGNKWKIKIDGGKSAEIDLFAKCLNKGFTPPLKGKKAFADLNYIEPNINMSRDNVHKGRAERDNIIEFNKSTLISEITASDIETGIKVLFKSKNFKLISVNLNDMNNLINDRTKEVRVSIKTPQSIIIPQNASKLVNITITSKKDGTYILKGDVYLDKKFHQYIE